MTMQARLLHRVDRAGSVIGSDMTDTDIQTLWPALKGLGALWLAARMQPRQRAPLMMHCGRGREIGGGHIGGAASAPNGRVKRMLDGAVRPVLSHDATADSYMEIEYDIPQSYQIYAVWSVPATGSAGMIGNGSPTGWRFYSSSTSLGLRHSAATNLVAGGNVRTDGNINVGWACYNHATTTVYSAAMNGAVARLNHYSTQVWASAPPPRGDVVRVGSADGVGAAHSIYDAIVVPQALYVTDNARHDTIVAALAANYGLSAA